MIDFNKVELTTSVNVLYEKKDDKDVYHFLYGSQLYGTLFGIFGKFQGTRVGSAFSVTSLSLEILNYKGHIDMGFTTHEPYFDGEKDIFFAIQAFGSKEGKTLPFDKPLFVSEGSGVPLVFNRILYPMEGFEFDISKRNSEEEMDKTIKGKESGRTMPKKNYFDSEFQSRNGLGYFDNVLLPGMYGFENLSLDEKDFTLPSGRCHTSNVRLFI